MWPFSSSFFASFLPSNRIVETRTEARRDKDKKIEKDERTEARRDKNKKIEKDERKREKTSLASWVRRRGRWSRQTRRKSGIISASSELVLAKCDLSPCLCILLLCLQVWERLFVCLPAFVSMCLFPSSLTLNVSRAPSFCLSTSQSSLGISFQFFVTSIL